MTSELPHHLQELLIEFLQEMYDTGKLPDNYRFLMEVEFSLKAHSENEVKILVDKFILKAAPLN